MHQPILVDTDIDEGAKISHIGDHALEYHCLFQVLDVFHAFLEGGGLELGPGVATGFFQFGDNIPNRGQAKLVIGVISRIQASQKPTIPNESADFPLLLFCEI